MCSLRCRPSVSCLLLFFQVLFKAGEQKFGTDEQTFVTLLGNRSAQHLRKGLCPKSIVHVDPSSIFFNVITKGFWICVSVFDAYMKLSGYEIEESIKRETSGSLKDLLLAVGKKTTLSSMWICSVLNCFWIFINYFILFSFSLVKWSVPGAYQPILLRPSTMPWK